MAIFKGFAASLNKGSQPAQTEEKKKVVLPQKKGGLFSGFASSLKAKETAPQAPVPPPAPVATPPKQALAPVFKAAGPYLPGGPSAKPVAPAPVVAPVQAPTIPKLPPTVAPGPRKSLLPTSAPVSPLPTSATPPAPIQATGQFAKFAPLLQKTGTYLPTTKQVVRPDKIEAPKPTWSQGKGFLPTAVRETGNVLKEAGKRVGEFRDTVLPTAEYNNETKKWEMPNITAADRGIAAIRAGIGIGDAVFAPVTGGLMALSESEATGANKFNPALIGTKLAAKGVLKTFEGLGKAASFGVDKTFDALPQTEQIQKFRPVATEVTNIALMAIVGKLGYKGTKVPKALEEMKTRSLTSNDVVSSAKRLLDLPEDANIVGQQKRSSLAEIREKFEVFNQDKTLSPKEVELANTAKTVLEDYAKLSKDDFYNKYKPTLDEVQKKAMAVPTIKDIDDTSPSVKPLVRPEARPEVVAPKPETNKFVEAPRFEAPSVVPKVTPKVETKPFIATASAKVATEGATKAVKAATVPSKTIATKAPAVPKVEAIKPVKFDSKNLFHKSVMTDILGAESAAKIANTGDLSSGVIFGRRPDSLPKWIPSELRRGPLVKSVMQHINDGTLPVRAAENQLYRVITNQMKGESTAPARTRVPRVEAEAKVAPLTKVKFDEANPKHFEVLEQMANAKAGVREGIQTEAGRVQVSTKSTFPKWIPEDLRQKPLLDAVSTHIYEGTVPKSPRETRLYNIVAQEMGIKLFDKKALEAERANLFDPFATKEENAAILAEFDRLNGLDTPKAKEQLKELINKTAKSRVYDRLQKETGELSEDLTYQKQNLKENAEKAVDLIATDKDKAYRVAMGLEKPPEGQTATAVNIAMAEKALNEGNNKLYADLVRARSIDQTRRGQELVAEKGSITDNSVSRYTKELIAARLEQLGDSYLANVKSNLPSKKGSSIEKTRKAKATQIIDDQVAKVSDRIKKAKVMDIAEAQKFLDSLAC